MASKSTTSKNRRRGHNEGSIYRERMAGGWLFSLSEA